MNPTTSKNFTTPDDPTPWQLLIDGKRAAAVLCVSPRTLAKLTSTGELPSVKVGRRRLYRLATLAAWVEGREEGGVADATT